MVIGAGCLATSTLFGRAALDRVCDEALELLEKV